MRWRCYVKNSTHYRIRERQSQKDAYLLSKINHSEEKGDLIREIKHTISGLTSAKITDKGLQNSEDENRKIIQAIVSTQTVPSKKIFLNKLRSIL